jgi:uncharacterized protein with PIN domain
MKSFEEKEKKKIKLSKCPKCGRTVPPIKRPSVAGVWFLSWIYLIYYYGFKKPECPYCGCFFSKKEMLEEE